MESSEMYGAKAEQCMKEAIKAQKGSFFGNIFSNKTERSEEALELFKQAATNFKLAKRWDEASDAYLKCVECDIHSKNGQAADFYQEAANVKERVSTAECIQLLEKSIEFYLQNNRISNIAKTQKRIAEIYEKECEYTLAIRYYREAADNYSLEQNQTSSTNTCMLKIVEVGIYASTFEYGEFIKILEQIAEKYMQNKLTSSSAKELYFKALLLFLAHEDVVGAKHALERYINNDPTFLGTRQQKFCEALIKSVDESNLQLFSNECAGFNEIIPLDRWKTTVLTQIKQSIPAAAALENNEGKNKNKPIDPEPEIEL